MQRCMWCGEKTANRAWCSNTCRVSGYRALRDPVDPAEVPWLSMYVGRTTVGGAMRPVTCVEHKGVLVACVVGVGRASQSRAMASAILAVSSGDVVKVSDLFGVVRS